MSEVDFSTKSYLVVDDFAAMLALIRDMLRSFGALSLDQASNGAEAIALMERKRYDVVLCDYNLGPGRDGQQVLEEARYRELIGIGAIFMMVTGETSREMVMGAMENAPDTYLTKPFTPSMLKTRLAHQIKRKENLGGVAEALLTKQHGEALHELDRLLAQQPRNRAELLRLKADICLLTARNDKALAIFDQVRAEFALDWALLGQGRILFQQRRYDEAHTLFARLVEKDPNLMSAYDWLARTQVAELAFDEAEQTLKKALALSPRSLDRQRRLGELALQHSDGQTAEAAFERAVALGQHSILNHPALYVGLAKSKSFNRKFEQALSVAGEIRRRFADRLEASIYEAGAVAFVRQDRGDESGAAAALDAAERAIARLNGGLSPRLSLEMVMTCFRLGEAEKASDFLHKSIANNHDDHEFLTEVVRVCHATSLEQTAERAIGEIQAFIAKTNQAGIRLLKQGDYDAAIHLLDEAAESLPGSRTFNLNAAKAWLIKMEGQGTTPAGLQTVRRYVSRVKAIAPNDWRLADTQARLRQLALKART